MLRDEQVSGRALIGKINANSVILSTPAHGTVIYTEQKLSVLQGTGSSYTGMQGGAGVVGHPHDEVEWEIVPQEGRGHKINSGV